MNQQPSMSETSPPPSPPSLSNIHLNETPPPASTSSPSPLSPSSSQSDQHFVLPNKNLTSFELGSNPFLGRKMARPRRKSNFAESSGYSTATSTASPQFADISGFVFPTANNPDSKNSDFLSSVEGSFSEAPDTSNTQTDDPFGEFVQSKYNLDVKSLLSMRQREREVAKKLVDDIIATEEVIEKLENRDAALSEISELMRTKLLPNDMVIYNFISSVASSENEMNLKLSAMKQELENLKRLRNVLVDNGGFEKNKLTCVICMDHKSEFMAAVCGHTCCRECSEKSTLSCHVCRGPAVWKRIFI